MKKRPVDPDDCCPICGVQLRPRHRCDDKTLADIDAANDAAGDEELFGRTYGERIERGFDMLDNGYDGAPDPVDFPEMEE